MQGSVLPIAVAHGEGRAEFQAQADAASCLQRGSAPCSSWITTIDPRRCIRSIPTARPQGLAGVCSADGRVTSVMPHPERVFRAVQNSWVPKQWGEDGGWMRLFRNARLFVA